MRKLYNCFVLFTIIIFASLAMEEDSKDIVTHTTKLARMDQVLEYLNGIGVNLNETAIFFDYDETLAIKIGEYKHITFKFLLCPDRERTYQAVFSAAFKDSSFDLKYFDLENFLRMGLVKGYEVLDKIGTTELICNLLENNCFLGVCSALPDDGLKSELVKYLGLDDDSYIYAENGKSKAIADKIVEIKLKNKKITTVVLIDNSGEFSIDPFLKVMPPLMKSLGFSAMKIIGIEYTKYEELATQKAITEELDLLKTLLPNSQEGTYSSSQTGSFSSSQVPSFGNSQVTTVSQSEEEVYESDIQ